eukprot:968057-Prorocentrum_lima.AAC.1
MSPQERGHLLTVLTGAFWSRSMLHRAGLADNPACEACGSAEETRQHVFYECPAWKHARGDLSLASHWSEWPAAAAECMHALPHIVAAQNAGGGTPWPDVQRAVLRVVIARHQWRRQKESSQEASQHCADSAKPGDMRGEASPQAATGSQRVFCRDGVLPLWPRYEDGQAAGMCDVRCLHVAGEMPKQERGKRQWRWPKVEWARLWGYLQGARHGIGETDVAAIYADFLIEFKGHAWFQKRMIKRHCMRHGPWLRVQLRGFTCLLYTSDAADDM